MQLWERQPRAATSSWPRPHCNTQYYFAERVDTLGAGVAHAPTAMTVDSLAAALTRALQPDVAARAKSFANAVRTDGAATAAEYILKN